MDLGGLFIKTGWLALFALGGLAVFANLLSTTPLGHALEYSVNGFDHWFNHDMPKFFHDLRSYN